MKRFDGFMHGVNLGGWLSQCDYSKERLDNFITEADFERIAACGLDHVRLPIDYNVLENADGSLNPEGFDRVERAVYLSQKHSLNIIIDLHKTAGFSFDSYQNETGFFESEAYRERFYAIWREMSIRLKDRPNGVAFELLNEVTDKSYMPVWMKTARRAFEIIRENAPESKVLVGGYWNNSVEAVKDLDAPWDENTVYNFHCYDPMIFTHQHAPWVKNVDVSGDVRFEESGASPEYFENRFAEAIKTADERNAYLYCGEYGVIENASPEDTLKWFKAITKVFDAHGIGRAAWSYKNMDFGIFDKRLEGVRDELVRML